MATNEPYGPPIEGTFAVMPNWYEQWGTGGQPSHTFQYQWEPVPCSCGRTTRHLFATHWFRLIWMRERW